MKLMVYDFFFKYIKEIYLIKLCRIKSKIKMVIYYIKQRLIYNLEYLNVILDVLNRFMKILEI